MNTKPGKKSPRVRQIECLEDRSVPATLTQSLFPTDLSGPQQNSQFGFAIASSSNYHVVGAPQTDISGIPDAGQAFIFDGASNSLRATLNDPTPDGSDNFGYSVGVDGNVAVVGAPNDRSGLAMNFGSVYLFDALTGAPIATLHNPAVSNGNQFGYSVAISGNMIVVGAPGNDTVAVDAGCAYVFNATTFALVATLNNPAPTLSDLFGNSVAVSGNTAIVGAYKDDTGAVDVGSAYVFNASTGALLRTLNKISPVNGDQFAFSVAISGDIAVVGAPLAANVDTGSAYIYNITAGTLVATLNGQSTVDNFGISVAVNGNSVAVGAWQSDTGATDAGSAYLYNASNGALLRTINNPAPAASDRFGASVAIWSNVVWVGAHLDDGATLDGGSDYAFNATNGSLFTSYTNPTLATYDYFGCAVAATSSRILVGTGGDDAGASNSGSAYLFDAASGNLVATTYNPVPGKNDNFGAYVGMSDSTVIVSAYLAGNFDYGAAYLYSSTTGAFVATLINPTPEFSDNFGVAIATSGNLAAVGAWQDNAGASDAGAVYLYDTNTGALVRTIVNPEPAIGDHFGSAVAMSGNLLVVGAYLDDAGATDAGTAYVFDATTGALICTLVNPAPAVGDSFGNDVGISGNYAVVGASLDDDGASNGGSAYVFDVSTGNLIGSLTRQNPIADDKFGYDVSIFGSTVAVGCPFGDAVSSGSGMAYVFDAQTCALVATIINPTPATSDQFGWSTEVTANSIFVSAVLDNTVNIDEGAVYAYSRLVHALSIGPVTPSPRNNPVSSIDVVLSDPVNLSTFSSSDFSLSRDGGLNLLSGLETVTFVSGTTYRISGLESLTGVAGEYNLTLSMSGVTDLSGDLGTGSVGVNWSVDTSAPTISGMYFDGSKWTSQFRVAAGNALYGFPAQTTSEQMTSMPWSTVDTVRIQFSEDVVVVSADLEIRGLNVASVSIAGFSYSSSNHLASWFLAKALETDRLIVDLDGDGPSAIMDAAGNRLAGSWIDGVTGFPTIGAAGVDFRYRFVVAVGDADRNGMVRNADVNLVRSNLFLDAGQQGYSIFADIDGDGITRNPDTNTVRSHLFIDPPNGPGPNRPRRIAIDADSRRNVPNSPTRFVSENATIKIGNSTRKRSVFSASIVPVIDEILEQF